MAKTVDDLKDLIRSDVQAVLAEEEEAHRKRAQKRLEDTFKKWEDADPELLAELSEGMGFHVLGIGITRTYDGGRVDYTINVGMKGATK